MSRITPVTRLALFESEPVASGRGTLYRALRGDVRFRFVEIGGGEGPEYEVIREHGTPDREGGVVRIEPFEVPEEADDAFLAGWDDARGLLGGRQGYLGARLHRSVEPARFRFVDLARWSSPLMVQRADLPSGGALYVPVR